MISAVVFSNMQRTGGPATRGAVFDLLLLSLTYDAEHFDVLAVVRNHATRERTQRLFLQEPDDRHVQRGVEWLLELVDLVEPAAVLRSPLHRPGCWCPARDALRDVHEPGCPERQEQDEQNRLRIGRHLHELGS